MTTTAADERRDQAEAPHDRSAVRAGREEHRAGSRGRRSAPAADPPSARSRRPTRSRGRSPGDQRRMPRASDISTGNDEIDGAVRRDQQAAQQRPEHAECGIEQHLLHRQPSEHRSNVCGASDGCRRRRRKSSLRRTPRRVATVQGQVGRLGTSERRFPVRLSQRARFLAHFRAETVTLERRPASFRAETSDPGWRAGPHLTLRPGFDQTLPRAMPLSSTIPRLGCASLNPIAAYMRWPGGSAMSVTYGFSGARASISSSSRRSTARPMPRR